MSERTDQEFLGDIREAIRRGMTYVAGMSYEAFILDTKTQDAVIRALEVLGEATKNLSEDMCARYPGIPWKNMAGTRDVLIHHYFGINLDVVWQIVTIELPQVATQLETMANDNE